MKKCIYPIYSDTIHLDMLLLIYAAMFGITFLFSGNLSKDLFLYVIEVCLLVYTFKYCSFALMDQHGVKVYRLFQKPIYMNWDQISNWGIVTKKNRINECRYFFLSNQAFTSAPWEKMPPINTHIVYFSYHSKLRKDLLSCGIVHIAKSLPVVKPDQISKIMKPKLIGTSIMLIVALTGVFLMLYTIGLWSALFWVLPSCFYALLLFMTIDWS